MFSVQETWAVGIAQSMISGSMPYDVAASAARMLCSMTPEALEVAFSKGRSCLLVLRIDDKWQISERLLSITEEAEELAEIRRLCRLQGKQISWTGVDVQPMLTQLCDRVQFANNADRN